MAELSDLIIESTRFIEENLGINLAKQYLYYIAQHFSVADDLRAIEAINNYQQRLAALTVNPSRLEESYLFELHGQAQGVTASLVFDNGAVSMTFMLHQRRTLIGRADPASGSFADIDLSSLDPHSTVSRYHARIIFDHHQFYIEDLGSRNGTAINFVQLRPNVRYILSNGDLVEFGAVSLRFVLEFEDSEKQFHRSPATLSTT